MWPYDLPVRETLRLAGETLIAWAVFDAGWYRSAYAEVVATLADPSDNQLLEFYLTHGQGLGHSPNRYFDEAWHLRTYPGIAAAVRDGHFASAFDSYCRTGNADRSPHWLFDEAAYRRHYPDLTNDVLAGADLANGYDHFLRHGNAEGRIGHAMFDPLFYARQAGLTESQPPFQHYLTALERGGTEAETSRYFDSAWYLGRYPEVADGLSRGIWRSPLEHYLSNDTPIAFDPSADFSEEWYLGRDPGLRAAIEAGAQRNGYAHFLRHGATELRAPAPHIDLHWYAMRDRVRESLLRGEAPDPFTHWLAIGKPAGDQSAPAPEEQIGEGQARTLFRDRAAMLALRCGRAPLRFDCTGEPELSVTMVIRGDMAANLATLVSLRDNISADIELILIVLGTDPDVGDIARFVTGAAIQRLDATLGDDTAYDAGFASAQADAVLCLSAGIEIEPGAIEAGLRRLRSDPRIGAVGGMVLRPHGRLRSAGYVVWNDGSTHGYLDGESPLVPEANFVRDVHFCGSDFLLTRRDAVTTAASTDRLAADACVRIQEAGGRVVYDPTIVVRVWRDREHWMNPRLDPQDHAAFLATCHAPDGRALVDVRTADRTVRRVLFIEDTVPLRSAGSGFVRSNDILRAMAALGFAVTVFPVNGSRFGLGNVYADMPETAETMHDQDLSRLAAFLRARRGIYDTIWVARTHNMDRVRPILDRVFAEDPNPPSVVLDTEAVSAVRAATRAVLDGRDFDLTAAIRDEFASAGICRTIVAVSDAEAGLLRDLGCEDVRTIGHMRTLQPTGRPFAQRAGILFAGAIHRLDSPNYDSLCWFVDAVLPLIEQSLGWETRLTIAGFTGPGVTLDRFKGHPRVTLRGAVANLEPLYASHRLFVAPTRFAAGAPYKVHEAASFGLPVVATTLLSQQLGWDDGQELLAMDAADPAGFAARIVALYRDEQLWNQLRLAALDRLAKDNDPAAYHEAVAAALHPR